MPIARFEFPDGRIGRFEVPEGTSPEQAQSMIEQSFNKNQPEQKESGFFESMGENFKHGLQSGKDLLTGDFQAIGQYKPTPKTEALADKLFKGIDNPSIAGMASAISRNIGDTVPSDYTGAILEKFGETPAGKAASAIGGIHPVFNAIGTATEKYVIPAIEEVTGAHPDNIAFAGLAATPFGLKQARVTKDPLISTFKNVQQRTLQQNAPVVLPPSVPVRNTPVVIPSKAINKVEARLRADFPDEASYQRALNSYASKKDQSLIEAGGERTANLAEGSAMYPSGGAKAAEFFDKKIDVAPEKLKTTLSKTVSDKTNYYDTLETVMQQGREQAAPLYSEAFKANQNVRSPVIDRILETPEGKSALTEAVKNMQNEMSLVSRPDPELTALAREAGMLSTGVGVGNGLKLRTLDYIKKSMDDSINKAYRAGDEAEARRVINLKTALVREMDSADVTGLYAKARKTSGDYLSNRDAMEFGLKFLNEDSEVIARNYKEMGATEKAAYKIGVTKAIRNKIELTTNGRNVAELFEKTATQKKLQSILSPREYQKLMDDAKAIDEIYKLRNQITGNSRTAMRQMAREEFEQVGSAIVSDLVTGTGIATGKRVVVDFIRKQFDGMNDKLAGEVADILYQTDPKIKYQIVKQLYNQSKRSDDLAIYARKKLDAFYSMSDVIARERAALIPDIENSVSPGIINSIEGQNKDTPDPVSTPIDERNDAPAPVNLKDVPVEKPQSWRNAPDADQRLAMAESGGDPNAQNPNSSASGLYQFTDPTWNSMVNKYGRKYGITKADKNDPQAQNIMLQHLKADNARQLQAKGLPVNDETLYFAHFMGAPAATKAMNMLGKKANAARTFPSAAKANPTIFYQTDNRGKPIYSKPRTIDQVYQLITSKVA